MSANRFAWSAWVGQTDDNLGPAGGSTRMDNMIAGQGYL